MALVIHSRKVAQTATVYSDGNGLDKRLVVPIEPEGEPSHVLHPAQFEVKLHLASNNSHGIKTYAAYIRGVWIGNIETAGDMHAACRAHIPKDYKNLMSKSLLTPVGTNLRDGCYLLCKHAGIIPNTPRSPNTHAKVTIPQ